MLDPKSQDQHGKQNQCGDHKPEVETDAGEDAVKA
jgi:hypothetical protein